MDPRIETIEFRKPGPAALSAILPHLNSRRCNLSLLPEDHEHCAWCNTRPLPNKRHKYCDRHCSDSAFMYCNPQSKPSRMYVLTYLQHSACTLCGLDYSDFIKELIDKRWKAWTDLAYWRRVTISYGGTEHGLMSLSYLGDQCGSIWEVDHIEPIFKGGIGIGFDNIQVVCKACHKQKSIAERRK